MFSINPKLITWAIIVVLLFITTDVYGGFGRNEIGLKVGMINPRDYEPYFPIQSEELEEIVQYGNAALYFFYLRNINSELNAGIDIGFTGILDKSDNDTILKAYPIDIYMAAEVLKLLIVSSSNMKTQSLVSFIVLTICLVAFSTACKELKNPKTDIRLPTISIYMSLNSS